MNESPSGATVPMVDSTGAEWIIFAGQAVRNGIPISYTRNVAWLLYYNHVVYQQNQKGNWYKWVNNSFQPTTDPRPVVPTESPQSTTLNSTTGTIYDANLVAWTLVTSTSSGLQIAKAGTVDTTTANVTLLLYWNHTIYQQNSAGGWWAWVKNAWSNTTDPRVAPLPPNSNLAIHLAATTGKTVPNTLFGFCGGGLVYGNNRNNDFDTVFDTKFQASAAKLKPGLIRLNTQQTEPLLQNVFANGVGSPNWAWLDNWINNHAGFFNDATSRLVFGIGPAFADTSIDAGTWASWATAVANHLIAAGQECFYWEIGNEPDSMNSGSYCNYFNTIADALHAVNPNYKCGGPVTSYWGGGGLDQPFLSNCTSRIGYIVWHNYGFSGSTTPSSAQAYQQALSYTNIASIRSEVSSHGLPTTIPLSVQEYNMVLDGGNNGVFDAAMFSCLFMTGCFQSDPTFTMGAVWDLVGPNGGFPCIGNSFVGDNGTIDPQGWYLGMAGQLMPGAEVTTSTTLGNLQVLASKTAKTWAVQIANYDTSGNNQTITLGITGGTVGVGMNMWQLDAANPSGTTTALTGLTVACPGPSITILTGTYS